MKHIHSVLIALTMSSSVLANPSDDPFAQQGLSGELSLFGGYSGGESNFNTDNETKSNSLNSTGESDSTAMFMPFGQLRYTFGSQQLFVGTSREDIVEGVFALEIGYAFEFDKNSVLSFSYLPTIANGETWEDPYLLNTKRSKTDISGNAYRVQYLNVLDIGLDADFAYYDRDIDNELSGSTLTSKQSLLERDGNGYFFQLSSGLPLSQNLFLMPSISYQQFSADGKAMSFDKYGLGLTVMNRFGNHAIALNGDYSKSDYDAKNPLFNKTREDSSYGFNLSYEYSDFMGWKNVGFNALAGYEKTDSNITFYDEYNYMIGIGVSYLF